MIFLTVQVEEVPHVPESRRFEAVSLGEGMIRLRVRVGFAEDVNVPALLARSPIEDVALDPMKTSFFLGAGASDRQGEPRHGAVAREALRRDGSQLPGREPHFHLPPNRVVELLGDAAGRSDARDWVSPPQRLGFGICRDAAGARF